MDTLAFKNARKVFTKIKIKRNGSDAFSVTNNVGVKRSALLSMLSINRSGISEQRF